MQSQYKGGKDKCIPEAHGPARLTFLTSSRPSKALSRNSVWMAPKVRQLKLFSGLNPSTYACTYINIYKEGGEGGEVEGRERGREREEKRERRRERRKERENKNRYREVTNLEVLCEPNHYLTARQKCTAQTPGQRA